jgi:hypothetical protein
VPIEITLGDDGYIAEVTPPHGGGDRWSTSYPMTADELVEALIQRGCHQTDIADALDAADPEWRFRE